MSNEQSMQSSSKELSAFDRKYRPTTTEDVIGNLSTMNLIKQGILTKTLPRTILFVSPPGNGKTSTSRVIGSMISCKSLVTEESYRETVALKESLLVQSREILAKAKNSSIRELGEEEAKEQLEQLAIDLQSHEKEVAHKKANLEDSIKFKMTTAARNIEKLKAKQVDATEKESMDITSEIAKIEVNLNKEIETIKKSNTASINSKEAEIKALTAQIEKLNAIKEADLLALGNKRKSALEIESGKLSLKSDKLKLRSVGSACGNCPTCLDIEEKLIHQGLSVNGIYEIDSSKITSKKIVADIIQQVTTKPVGLYTSKVLIMDEIQDLDDELQDSFLKLFEEPPSHLTIILNTTNPEKLKPAIQSRCRRYTLKKPQHSVLVEHLRKISESEGIDYEMRALSMIVNKKNRAIRDSIIALESVATLGAITVENVVYHLDVISEEEYVKFFQATQGDISELIEVIEDLELRDVNFNTFFQDMSKFILDCIKMKYGVKLESYTEAFYKEARKVFDVYEKDDMIKILQIFDYYRTHLGYSAHEQKVALMMFGIKIGLQNLLGATDAEIAQDAKKEKSKSDIAYLKHNNDRMDIHTGIEEPELTSEEDVALALGTSMVNKKTADISDVLALLGATEE